MSYYDLSAGEDGSCDDSSSSSSFQDGYDDWGKRSDGYKSRPSKDASDKSERRSVTRSQYRPSITSSNGGTRNTTGGSNDSALEEEHGRDPLWGRSILHLDVDCFYCQCEEIDRNLRTTPVVVGGDGRNSGTFATSNTSSISIRPLAIGQKHIIVTCNYEARRLGVKKLQSRVEAIQACPELMIVEGSDLRQYRRHSRAIYRAFRRAVFNVARAALDVPRACDDEEGSGDGRKGMPDDDLAKIVPARKGSMDEMMVDLSQAIDMLHRHHHESRVEDAMREIDEHMESILGVDCRFMEARQGWYIFGEESSTSATNMVEDQTGTTTTVSMKDPSIRLSESRRNVHELYRSGDRQACRLRLHIASRLAAYICDFIKQETDFSTTVGVSVSPLLAKLASGLNKPKSVNILYPWRSATVMYGMPLRKMHEVGHKTMKVLEGALSSSVLPSSPLDGQPLDGGVKTVRHLLEVPREEIVGALLGLQSIHRDSAGSLCDLLLDRCKGLDLSTVEDDGGGLPKTVSVENSFRRGTVRTLTAVWTALNELCVRLPRLLCDRTSWSDDPLRSYPTTLRLTTRMMDSRLSTKGRPFVTHSKQTAINGKVLLKGADGALEDEAKQAEILKEWVTPLVQQLILPSVEINLTRLSLAVTNFPDTMIPIHLKQHQSTDWNPNFSQPNEKQTPKRRLGRASWNEVIMENEQSTKKVPTSTPPPPKRRKQWSVRSRESPLRSGTTTTRIDHFFFRKV